LGEIQTNISDMIRNDMQFSCISRSVSIVIVSWSKVMELQPV